ncbi:MAG: carbohydrate ABC transporter substrate-binding protein [Ruminococcaceae bacterium]|nr:carbohydrate ABC transporter substrate-binding protein [Oscillospiraceae bacterium]
MKKKNFISKCLAIVLFFSMICTIFTGTSVVTAASVTATKGTLTGSFKFFYNVSFKITANADATGYGALVWRQDKGESTATDINGLSNNAAFSISGISLAGIKNVFCVKPYAVVNGGKLYAEPFTVSYTEWLVSKKDGQTYNAEINAILDAYYALTGSPAYEGQSTPNLKAAEEGHWEASTPYSVGEGEFGLGASGIQGSFGSNKLRVNLDFPSDGIVDIDVVTTKGALVYRQGNDYNENDISNADANITFAEDAIKAVDISNISIKNSAKQYTIVPYVKSGAFYTFGSVIKTSYADFIAHALNNGNATQKANANAYNNIYKTAIGEYLAVMRKLTLLERVPAKYKDGKTTVSIVTWWTPSERELIQMENFQEKTGIKTKFIVADWTDDASAYVQKVASLRVMGAAPDIACATTSTTYPSMYLQGLFRPLSESKLDLSNSDVLDLETMNKLKWNGTQYGAIFKNSVHMNMGVMLYNKDIFDFADLKTPYEYWQEGTWNWDNFVKLGKKLLARTNIYPVSAGYQGHRLVQTCGVDGVIFDKNGRLVNNTSNQIYRNGYKWLNNISLCGEHQILHYGDHGTFKNEECAMYVVDNWILQAGQLDNLDFNVGFAPLPTPDGEIVVPCDAQLWGFVDGARNIEAASYVLEYWQNPDYAPKDYPIWMSNSVAEFNNYLWAQPKTFQLSHAITNFGGDYNYYYENYYLATCGVANVDSRVNVYSTIIEANLQKIYSEFN